MIDSAGKVSQEPGGESEVVQRLCGRQTEHRFRLTRLQSTRQAHSLVHFSSLQISLQRVNQILRRLRLFVGRLPTRIQYVKTDMPLDHFRHQGV